MMEKSPYGATIAERFQAFIDSGEAAQMVEDLTFGLAFCE